MKAAERKPQIEYSTHMQEIEIIAQEIEIISKNTFFYRRPPVAASLICNLPVQLRFIQVNFLHAEYGI